MTSPLVPLPRPRSPVEQAVTMAGQSANATLQAGFSALREGIGLTIERTGEAISEGGRTVARCGAASAIFIAAGSLLVSPGTTPLISWVLAYSGLFTGGKPIAINDPGQPGNPWDVFKFTSAVAACGVAISVAGVGIQKLGKKIQDSSGGSESTASTSKKSIK